MKILHIITGLDHGGAEGLLCRLIAASSTETEHIVISLGGLSYYGPSLLASGVEVHTLEMPTGRVTFSGLLALRRIIRASSPDVVQTWMYHADLLGGLIARWAGIRAVCWNIRNSNLVAGKSSFSARAAAKICAHISNRVPARIICCSEQAAKLHQSIGYHADKFVVIPNGYDIAQFSPSKDRGTKLREEWRIRPDEWLLGMVARWDPQKDHASLFSAIASVRRIRPQLRCVLVGLNMDHHNTELVTLIATNGLQDSVVLAGPRDDIPAVMNALDLHVLSSSYGEAFPNVVAEAMACGTPCVVTDVGDAPLIVGKTGRVVAPNNPGLLAQAIEQVLLVIDSPQSEEAKQACRQRIVKNFDINRITKLYCDIWSECAVSEKN